LRRRADAVQIDDGKERLELTDSGAREWHQAILKKILRIVKNRLIVRGQRMTDTDSIDANPDYRLDFRIPLSPGARPAGMSPACGQATATPRRRAFEDLSCSTIFPPTQAIRF
jgi:hypothetical protein